MKTYLVPVDFSDVSVNTAEFAAALSHQTRVEHIILLNAYYVSSYETMLPNPDMVLLREQDIEDEVAERNSKLNTLKDKLTGKVRMGVKVSVRLSRSHLLRAVVDTVSALNADLVILGSHGNSSNTDSDIGSHVVKIAKACPVPVVVVPPHYKFDGVQRVVVACDFKKVKETAPVEGLKQLLERTGSELLAVNVGRDANLEGEDAEALAKQTHLYGMLQDHQPKYYYINNPDVMNGILQFAADKDARLVIALPRKYSFFQSLMHNSISKKLAENALVPVMLLK
jgi:nucleotide-binding universal stress UspA family protein